MLGYSGCELLPLTRQTGNRRTGGVQSSSYAAGHRLTSIKPPGIQSRQWLEHLSHMITDTHVGQLCPFSSLGFDCLPCVSLRGLTPTSNLTQFLYLEDFVYLSRPPFLGYLILTRTPLPIILPGKTGQKHRVFSLMEYHLRTNCKIWCFHIVSKTADNVSIIKKICVSIPVFQYYIK